MSREPIPNDRKTREQIVQVIKNQFELELLLKQREILTIEGELEQGEKLLKDLREAISAGIQLAAGNQTRNTSSTELGDSSPVTKGGKGKNAARKSYDALYSRRADGTFVKLACPECGRTKFLNQQGFINHCRISHDLEFSSHEQSNYLCGTPVDESEVPLDHPCRRRIATHSLATIFTKGGGLGSMERKLNDEMKDQLSTTLHGMQKPTIKVFEEDVDLDNEEPSSAQPRLSSKAVKSVQSKSTPLRTSFTSASSSSSCSSSSSSCSSSDSDSDSSASFNFGKRRRSILSKYPRKRDQPSGSDGPEFGHSGKSCRKHYKNSSHGSNKHPKYAGKMPTKYFSGKRMNVNTEIKEESDTGDDEKEESASNTILPSRKSVAPTNRYTNPHLFSDDANTLDSSQEAVHGGTIASDHLTSLFPTQASSTLDLLPVVSAQESGHVNDIDASPSEVLVADASSMDMRMAQQLQSSDLPQSSSTTTNVREALEREEAQSDMELDVSNKTELANQYSSNAEETVSGPLSNIIEQNECATPSDSAKLNQNSPNCTIVSSESQSHDIHGMDLDESSSNVQKAPLASESKVVPDDAQHGGGYVPSSSRVCSLGRLESPNSESETLDGSSCQTTRKDSDVDGEAQSQESFIKAEPLDHDSSRDAIAKSTAFLKRSTSITPELSSTSTPATVAQIETYSPPTNLGTATINEKEDKSVNLTAGGESATPSSIVANKTSITSLPTYDSYASGLRQILSATNNQHHGSRFYIKKRVIVGNVSKFIPTSRRKRGMEHYSHKWMVYVEFPTQEKSQDFISKVRVFLHPSYKPHDVVDLEQPPFRLTRYAWGEFPIRLQLHFYDSRNKPVDIIHQLKLDDERTGRQVLGGERFFDLELDRNTVFGKEGRLVEMATSGSIIQTVNGLCKICGTNHQVTSDHPNYLLGQECKIILEEINCGVKAFSSLTSSSELGRELGDDWEADVDHDDELDIDIDDDFSTSSFTSTAKDIVAKATQTPLYQEITLENPHRNASVEQRKGTEWIWKTVNQLNLPGTTRLTSTLNRQRMKLHSHPEEQRAQIGNLLLEIGKIFLTRLTKRTLQIQAEFSAENSSETDHQNPMYDQDYNPEEKFASSLKAKNPKDMLTPLHLVEALLNHPEEYDFLTNEYLSSQRQ
ncbi:hypothetical protein K493DRAFT_341439 [Basidiobolus meristosporus CBS 931.73]|uniref:YEATS domain-containing protein n=1 Tax=Basidiobolus meristosporus CBS 931.73 TaxID=1314790 RepID=A0A1Y1XQR9_9FUNG|nr:hypothetical protein K493DRAFT_341439 [Basidiobolus meristosporus CBS 931.73]|eukprot:ORX87846.1 hypothetical protein K493DRAFT_341439 [Basidiobolus meristosporus CBS 931.73]